MSSVVTLDSSDRIYDSAAIRRPLVTELRNFWEYRGLIRLLVARDLTVRYKRSLLGVWWTLLNPLLTTAVLWIVFSNLFKFQTEVPFTVYLLSGILLITYFSQGVIACGSAIVDSSGILTKVYVPAEVFSLAAAIAAATNFVFAIIPLLLVQLITGTGIPWTAPLIIIPIAALLATIAGAGLFIASGAVRFFDVIDLTNAIVLLIGYLTPSFYPLEIVPQGLRAFIYVNPLYSYLEIFRAFIYRGEFAPMWNFAVMGGTTVIALVGGVWVFSRSWKNLVVLL